LSAPAAAAIPRPGSVEVEAAQEILIRLAVAAVLRRDEAGHDFEHFGRTRQRTVFDLFAGDEACRCGVRLGERIGVHRIGDMDEGELGGRQSAGETGRDGSEQQRRAGYVSIDPSTHGPLPGR
jgi:hypothetical protein